MMMIITRVGLRLPRCILTPTSVRNRTMAATRTSSLFVAFLVGSVVAGCWRDFEEPFGDGSGGEVANGAAGAGGRDSDGGSGGDGASGAQGGGGTGGSVALCSDGTFCAPPAPEGWTGPVLLAEGSGLALPECPGRAVVPVAYSGAITAPDAVCNACSCGMPTGGSCAPVFVEFFDTCASSTVINVENLSVLNQCEYTNVNGLTDGDAGIHAQASVADPGSCSPSGGGVVELPAPSFGNGARVCAADGSETCDTGTCVAAPAGFLDTVCVAHEGEVDCPPGVYQVAHVIYTDYEDQRGCAGCSCDAPTGVVCGATVRAHQSGNCGNESSTVGSGSCVNVSSDVRSVTLTFNSITSFGSCAEGGGGTNGSVEPASLWTVCCSP